MFYNIFYFKFYRYQNGPDTYLLQLRDVSFPCRLRQYMSVAKRRSPSFNYTLSDSNYDLSVSDTTYNNNNNRIVV